MSRRQPVDEQRATTLGVHELGYVGAASTLQKRGFTHLDIEILERAQRR